VSRSSGKVAASADGAAFNLPGRFLSANPHGILIKPDGLSEHAYDTLRYIQYLLSFIADGME
jgi:hypothetical protein